MLTVRRVPALCDIDCFFFVKQEKRMNKATEVMMQYVENLKRTYEKDHAELMEFKKLANQNSNRCYGGSIDTGGKTVPLKTFWCLIM